MPVAVLLLLLPACSRSKVIPKKDMIAIYTEMFLADQWLKDNSSEQARADTMLFFDPIFKTYGYKFEDFDKSVDYYIEDPETYSEIIGEVINRLKGKSEQYSALLDENKDIRKRNRKYMVEYEDVDFAVDSLWQLSADIFWPETPVVLDSLATTDSTEVVDDGLEVKMEVLPVKEERVPAGEILRPGRKRDSTDRPRSVEMIQSIQS